MKHKKIKDEKKNRKKSDKLNKKAKRRSQKNLESQINYLQELNVDLMVELNKHKSEEGLNVAPVSHRWEQEVEKKL